MHQRIIQQTGEMSLQAEEEMIVVLIALCRLSMGSRTIVEGSQEVEGTGCGSISTSARWHGMRITPSFSEAV